MRGAFVRSLCDLAEADTRILLLTGDLGFSVVEPFADRFPERFYNVGVAEQNMIGLATGLAESGFIPFVYSIVTFASLRGYEFIRNGPILHGLPVRIVGVGGGFEYGPAGITHHGLEDLGVMRIQPGITVVAPADHEQTVNALRSTYALPRPVYYRIGKDDTNVVPGLDGRFALDRVQLVTEGGDLLMLCMGAVSRDVARVAETLRPLGISATVGVVSSFNPAPTDEISSLLGSFRVAITVETHYLNGALGSLVCEVAAESASACRIVRCGVRDSGGGVTGSEPYLVQRHGLSHDSLVETARLAVGSS